MQSNVRGGSPGGRSETTVGRSRICERGRFKPGVKEMELYMYKVVTQEEVMGEGIGE